MNDFGTHTFQNEKDKGFRLPGSTITDEYTSHLHVVVVKYAPGLPHVLERDPFPTEGH